MGKKSSSSPPPPPDLTPYVDMMLNASPSSSSYGMGREAVALGHEQLAWAKEQWGQQQALQKQVLDVQLPMMRDQARWAREDRARWENVFKPLEDEYVKLAEEWNTPEKQELQAGRAQADVTRAFESQRQNTLRNLEGLGIDPSQTRYQALDAQVRMQQAASQAGAGNQARLQTEQYGHQLLGNAIALGEKLPMQAVSTGQSAAGIGNSAMGASANLLNAGTNAMTSPTSYFGQVGGGSSGGTAGLIGGAVDILNSGYGNQFNAWNASNANKRADSSQMWGNIGTAVGAGAAIFMNEGGEAGKVAGEVAGPGGPKGDAIPAQLSDKEYVIPAEVVHYKGTEFFDKVVNKSHEQMGIPEEAVQMQDGVPVQGGQKNG